MMIMTMIVDGEDNHRDDNLDMIMAIIVELMIITTCMKWGG